ncbi:MAG: ABC transporter permease subunit, partial [Anaerolineae bacterium]|nr:ABC transporter permease subunit [Anaerolineae bacterium]
MSSITNRVESKPITYTTGYPAQTSRWAVRRTLENALIVTRREVRDSLRDWRIITPIFILTLVFPLLANGMTNMFISFFEEQGADPLLPSLLPLLPMIVGFFPVSISLVIALETFVGEKERLSLEPLLSTPLTNTELYLGKTFAAMIPPLMASYIGITIYISGLMLGAQQWRPPALLVAQIVALTTVQALVMVTGAVVVSSQTTSTRAANLLASFIIIPVSMLVMLESVIMV